MYNNYGTSANAAQQSDHIQAVQYNTDEVALNKLVHEVSYPIL